MKKFALRFVLFVKHNNELLMLCAIHEEPAEHAVTPWYLAEQ